MYNLTNITGDGNTTGLLNTVQGINDVLMFGYLGDIFLMGFAAILFITFYTSTQDVAKTLMGTFMIIFVLSISMVGLGLVHTLTTIIALIMLVAGVVLSYSSKQ